MGVGTARKIASTTAVLQWEEGDCNLGIVL